MASNAALKDVKSVITSLLVGYKNPYGIEVSKLNRDYLAVECINIPFKKFNYTTLPDFLKTIDCLDVYQRNGIYCVNFRGKETTKHLSELVARQKTSRNTRGRPMPCRRTIPSQYNLSQPRPQQPPRMSTAMFSSLCNNMLDIIRQNPNGISKDSLGRALRATCTISLQTNDINDMIKSLGFDVYIKDFTVFPARSSSYTKPATSNYSQNGTSHMENKIIPSSYSVAPPIVDCDSMDQMSFSSDSRAENQYNPNPMERKMPKQPISNSIGDSTAQVGNSIREKATPTPAPRENDLTKAFNEEDFIFSKNADYVASVLNERVQFRLTKLIQNRPEGIWCLELPKIYETEYKTPLEWENLGFQRLSDFASYLHHIFRVVATPDGRDFKLYDANRPLPSERDPAEWIPKTTLAYIHNIYDPKPPRAIPSNLPSAIAKRLAPDDVMVIGEAVGYISVTDYPEQEHIQVIVVEAYSPSFFWIQIYANRRIFDKMMADLHEYYEMHKAKYEIPLVVLEKGLNVACIYEGKWHRGIIKQVQPDSKVNVSFYDYGTRKTYRAHEVFFLQRMFSQLPAQAIPCGLANVKPYIGKPWTKPAIDCFIDFSMPYGSYETPHVLWAQVVSTNIENNSMLVSLTDTTTDDDVHIIDELYEKKLAARGKMEYIVNPENIVLYDPVKGYFDCPSVLESPDEPAVAESVGKAASEVSSSSAQNNEVISDRGQKDLTISDMNGLMDDFSTILNECVMSGIKMEYLLSANPQAPCQSVDTLPILTKKYVKNLVNAVKSRLNLNVTEVSPDATVVETKKPPEVPPRRVQQPVAQKPVEKVVKKVVEKPIEPPARAMTPQPANTSQPVSAAEFFRRQTTQQNSQPHGPAPRLSAVELDDSNPFKPYLLSQNQSAECRTPPGFLKTVTNNVEPRPQTPNAAGTAFDEFIKNHQDFNAQKANRSTEAQRGINSSADLIEKSSASESNSSIDSHTNSLNSAKSVSPVNSRVPTPKLDLSNGPRESSVKEIDLIPVALSKITVCFFCFDNCGWITMDHFRLAFTQFGDNEAIYRYFKLIGDPVPLRILTQTENPRLFQEYTKVNVKQMKNQREEVSGALSMVTLEFMLRMLRQLCIVTLEHLRNLADTPSPAVADLNALLKAFGEYQKSRNKV